MGREVGQG